MKPQPTPIPSRTKLGDVWQHLVDKSHIFVILGAKDGLVGVKKSNGRLSTMRVDDLLAKYHRIVEVVYSFVTPPAKGTASC